VMMLSDVCLTSVGGTGISGLMRGLATLPQRWIQEPLVVRNRDGRPQEDPLAVHCFCVCSGSTVGGSPWGKQIHGTWSSVCSVDLSKVFLLRIVYCHVLFCYMFMSVDCFGLVVSTCPPPLRLTTSVLWCWSWEKEGRAVEVDPGI